MRQLMLGTPELLRIHQSTATPAGRPAAITSDLPSFWAGPYAGVRADLRDKYKRHPWPEDPANAKPTKLSNRASMARPRTRRARGSAARTRRAAPRAPRPQRHASKGPQPNT